jgi:hypothetical protein
VYKDLENKTVDVGGGNVDEAKSLKNVQIVLIKLKINRGII